MSSTTAPARTRPARPPGAAAPRSTPSARSGSTSPPRPGARGPRGPRPGDPDRRSRALVVVLVLVLVLFAGRLVIVQGADASEVAAKAVDSRTSTTTLPATRGEITARDGSVLAASVERRDVVVDQTLVAGWEQEVDGKDVARGPKDAAAQIAPLLGVDEASIIEPLTGSARWALVAKAVTSAQWRAVDDLGIPGLYSERNPQRSYPAGSVAGNIIGWVGTDGEPRSGLEMSADDRLHGTPGSNSFERGLGGQRIPMASATRTAPVDGSDVRLTIDRDLQWYAQQAIDAQVSELGARWGAVTVMDPKTFEVLALADSGTVDPNDPGASDEGSWGNRSLQEVFEPGSTAKVVTAAAALEEGKTTPREKFTVPDRITVPNGQSFKDSHSHADERLTFAGVLGESSNTGTVMVGDRLDDDVRYDYLRRFGFGEKTALRFPGESAGLLDEPGAWDGAQRYTTMFGQGFAGTMLQSAQVYATLANGGVRLPAHVIEGVTASDGTYTPTPEDEGVRVVSKDTAKQVVSMLEGAVGTGGTGGEAAVPGYRVAGKTGTAQVAGAGGYDGNGYIGSFIGMAPAEDPQLVVAVSVAHPTEGGYYGGTVAGPVFSDVMSYALAAEQVPPSTTRPDLVPLTW